MCGAVDNWYQCLIIGMVIWYGKKCWSCMHVCCNRVIPFCKSTLFSLVQEPSSYVVPGLKFEGRYNLCLIIGIVWYMCLFCLIMAASPPPLTHLHNPQEVESQGRVRVITSDGEFERELREAGETLYI